VCVLISIHNIGSDAVSAAIFIALEPGGYYFDCKLQKVGGYVNPQSDNTDLASALWDLSEKLISEKSF
jgi:hypothetical protein